MVNATETSRASDSSWRPLYSPDLAASAVKVAREVAARLREREQVEAAAAVAAQQTAFPEVIRWTPYGVAQGYAGLALLWGYFDRCFPDEEWDVVGHRHLEAAARGAEDRDHLPLGMFSGLSGLGFAAWYLSRRGTRYHKLLTAVDELLIPEATSVARYLFSQQHGVSVGHFDVISGLAGTGAYLLERREQPGVSDALMIVLESLIQISQERDGLPLWHTPPRLMFDEIMLEQYPNGNLNCGLAHGIPGPLALLALAHGAGVKVEGLADTINRLASWLAAHVTEDAWGVNWPVAVPIEPDSTPSAPASNSPASSVATQLSSSRAAWCYGSPGVARALWLAGNALDRADYRQLAIRALEAVYRRPIRERRIDSATFCHGVAGLLQITLRFAHETGLAVFREAARALVEQVLSLYEPDTRLGYQSIERAGRRVDQPGLLDGAPGVALVLLAAATEVEPTWDRLFLLS